MQNVRYFILRTCLFGLPVLAGLSILELLARNLPNTYSYKWEYLENNKHKIQHLVLGNSHAYHGVNTDLIPSAFNAANYSQTLEYDEYIFSKFIHDLTSLKTVYITLSYPSLFSQLKNSAESWREKFYVLYWHSNRVKSFVTLEISDGTALTFKKVIRFFLLKQKMELCSQTGYNSANHPSLRSNIWQESGPVAARRHSIANRRETAYELNKNYILHIVGSCASKNIRVVVYIPPAWESYRHNLDAGEFQKTLCFAHKLAKDFSNVTFLNLLDDKRFVDEDFFDADHLNDIGAEKLTKILFEYAQY